MEEVPDVVPESTVISPQEIDVSESTVISPSEIAVPQPISLIDIANAMEVVQSKELKDKQVLESIGSLPFEALKTSLIQWAILGYPPAYVIHSLTIIPPVSCSDGVSRNLTDYVLFCSGQSMHKHIEPLQARMTDMKVSFANFGSFIGIVVSKS